VIIGWLCTKFVFFVQIRNPRWLPLHFSSKWTNQNNVFRFAVISIFLSFQIVNQGPSRPWSYGSWIYNYIMQPVPTTTNVVSSNLYQDKVWLATGQWFSPGPLVSSTNKTDCHNIAEILLKVALNTIKQTNKQIVNQY
jgi:hypothetical protein